MENFYFDTDGFKDPPEKIDENVNQIGGFNLATLLQTTLNAIGFTCDDVFAEDYGWAFEAKFGNTNYFCTASVDPATEDMPSGFDFFANINVEKRRSFLDKIRGQNKVTFEDPVIQVVRDALSAHGDVNNLKSSLF